MSSPIDRSRPVALVTGSTSGIGAGIARRLVREGFVVALHSRSSASIGGAMVEELRHASYTQADLAEESAARGLVREVLENHGRLDCLVNCAGISQIIPHKDLAGATPEIWRKLYDGKVIASRYVTGEIVLVDGGLNLT